MNKKVNIRNPLGNFSLSLLILLLGIFLSACTSSSEFLATDQPTPLPIEGVLPIETPAHTAVPAPTQPLSETVDVLPQSVTTFPDVSQYTWVTVLSGLNRPLDLTSAKDGSGKVYILEQNGRLIEATPGIQTFSVLLDIQDKVSRQGNEQGLLGIAFSPNFSQDRRFYLNYTDLEGDTVISRFRFAQGSSQVDPDSEQVLLTIKQPYANHNGGGIAFGPDGYLYIGMGDGGSAGDPENYAQSLNTLLGKMLRIDVSGDIYVIPKDNPFADGSGKPEIWAYGLRNPWRFSFDSVTGDLFIGDVGQNRIEEIDFLPFGSPSGANFGWKYFEGSQPYQGQPPSNMTLVNPVWEYTHADGCSVTGGVVYRGTALPEFNGIYLFGDYCNGMVWGLLRDSSGTWQARTLFQIDARISSFGTDEKGEVYVLDHSGGKVLKLVRN
ncbi:MAG: PQQ-dependent sugar dehydrogenase [Anaerolineales bacterium]